jgi:hypothetical protein
VLIVLGVKTLAGGNGQPADAGHATSSQSPAASNVTTLAPVSAHGFDIYSSAADDPQNENDQEAQFAIDGKASTAWHTQFYKGDPAFGHLKPGTGLILDMGKPVRLSSVTIMFGPVPGASVSIEVGNSNARAVSTLSRFTTVASASNVSNTYTFQAHGNATGQYVLIWFTKLPPQQGSPGQFMAQISNIVVRGSH